MTVRVQEVGDGPPIVFVHGGRDQRHELGAADRAPRGIPMRRAGPAGLRAQRAGRRPLRGRRTVRRLRRRVGGRCARRGRGWTWRTWPAPRSGATSRCAPQPRIPNGSTAWWSSDGRSGLRSVTPRWPCGSRACRCSAGSPRSCPSPSGRFGPCSGTSAWLCARVRPHVAARSRLDAVAAPRHRHDAQRARRRTALHPPDPGDGREPAAPTALLARIEAPTCFLWGEEDPMGGAEVARRSPRTFPTPSSSSCPRPARGVDGRSRPCRRGDPSLPRLPLTPARHRSTAHDAARAALLTDRVRSRRPGSGDLRRARRRGRLVPTWDRARSA